MNRQFTVRQAAKELNVSIHTIRAWIAQRRIGHVRLGRSVRVPETEIERLLSRGAVPAIEKAPASVPYSRPR